MNRSVASDWKLVRLDDLLTESRIPGSSGSDARRLSVKLYGKGVVPKINDRPGSAATRYYRRRSGQLVFSKLDFLNGAFGVIPDVLDGYESTLDLPCFDVAPGVDRDWLLAVVTRPAFYRRYRHVAIGSRKARRVPVNEFLGSALTLPRPQEQRAIAEGLRSMEETVRGAEVLAEQLSGVKHAVMRELLSNGLPEVGRQFRQTRIGRIPAGWEVRQIGTMGTFSGGHGFRPPDWSDGGLPIIRIQNLNGSRRFNYFAGEPDPRWVVEPGTLLKALVACPPLDEQRAIADVGEAFDARILVERRYLDRLRAAKAALAQALLSGRVRVPSGGRAGGGVA